MEGQARFSVQDYDGRLADQTTGIQFSGDVGTAGYVVVPADIKQACLVECARAYEIGRKKIWGQESHTSDGQSSSTNMDELLPATVATLSKYQRPRV
jgi:hypothetical protein